jgi:hypothetical protein
VVAKVARFDFPSQWPSLFNDLLAGIDPNQAAAAAAAAAGAGGAAAGPSLLLVRRTYFVLHHVLKELSSKRLAADQKAFAEVSLQKGTVETKDLQKSTQAGSCCVSNSSSWQPLAENDAVAATVVM